MAVRNIKVYTLTYCRHGNPDIVKILVGNKCDEVGKRKVSEVEAEMFAKNKNIEYIDVSALNASNVILVFETIGKHILHKKRSLAPS